MLGTKKDYINYRISKSKEIFDDAIILANNNRWNSCVNRLYYSSYYLASVILYKNDIKATTHNGVKIQLFKNYIKTNIIDKKYGKLFSHLFDWRQEADYADFIDFNKDIVEPLIAEVKEFNELLNKLANK